MDDHNQLDANYNHINATLSAEQQHHEQEQSWQQNKKVKIDDNNDEEASTNSDEYNIARRTRSHVMIDDHVLTDNLDFPDVEPNLYQNPGSVSDPTYKNFLYQCFSNAVELSNDNTNEENDPAYVYNDDVLSHGWKFDLDEELLQQQQQHLGQEVSDQDLAEASGGLTELFSVPNENRHQHAPPSTSSHQLVPVEVVAPSSCAVVEENYEPNHNDMVTSFADEKSAVASLSSVPGFKSPHKSGYIRRRIDYFDNPEFKRVLNQQLRQHIQLLTQTHLLASCMTNMQNEATEAKSHLNSYMKVFRNRNKPSNLLPAIKLVNDCVPPKELRSSIRLNWRQLPVPDMAKRVIKQNPNIFPYASLLPQVAFSVLPEKIVTKKPKIIFTPNEDKLLALALSEFESEYAQYAYIASLLMAAKTKMQINNHVKNIKRSPGNEDNPIRMYISHGRSPQVNLDSDAKLRDITTENFSILDDIEECSQLAIEDNASSAEDASSKQDNQQKQQQQLESEKTEVEQEHFFQLRQHVVKDVKEEEGKSGSVLVDQLSCEESQGCQKQQRALSPIHDVDDGPKPIVEYPPPESLPDQIHQQQEDEPEVKQQLQNQQIVEERPPSPNTLLREPASPIDQPAGGYDPSEYHNQDDMMNMDLDDLMAASTTISKNYPLSNSNSNNYNTNGTSANNNHTSISEKNIRNQKLRKSMLNLMSHKFLLSHEMGDLIVQDFLKTSQDKLEERDHIHLLQLMAELMRKETKSNPDSASVKTYNEISRFLDKIDAPKELHERLILFLNLDQATKCGVALGYLHWMRFFEFIHHVEMYHDGEALEKKLIRLIDAIQKDDLHKIKLATANLVNKHPLLKSEFEALSLEGKPHPSLFINEEDFDDITEPFTLYDNHLTDTGVKLESEHHETHHHHLETNGLSPEPTSQRIHEYEHFSYKPTQDEINFATQSCPCNCHKSSTAAGHPNSNNQLGGQQQQQQLGQHCNKCNIKFIKGRMYLVNKIKPFLAEWSYVDRPPDSSPHPSSINTSPANIQKSNTIPGHDTQGPPPSFVAPVGEEAEACELHWTFEEDKEILEFCQAKADQNDENVSFDTTTFEELVMKRQMSSKSYGESKKKGAKEIAERFNHLMEMYRRDDSATAAATTIATTAPGM